MGTDYRYIDQGTDDGEIFGKSATSLISVFGATPADQAAHITSVSTAAATTSTPYGYAASTQADAIVTAVNAVLVALEDFGVLAKA
jgi:hypothetical protein